jgi:uncharacterized membrane protein YkvA (DUF1232 family)
MSPEKFADQAGLSHMTIRRWLKRKDLDPIPEKYEPLLFPLFSSSPQQFSNPLPGQLTASSLMSEIEKSGEAFENVEKLNEDVNEKLKTARVDRLFVDYCKQLLAAIKSSKSSMKSKAVAIGALIYFVSPIDLIPDHIAVVGYLDDFAVLSLAVNTIQAEERKRLEKEVKAE